MWPSLDLISTTGSSAASGVLQQVFLVTIFISAGADCREPADGLVVGFPSLVQFPKKRYVRVDLSVCLTCCMFLV